MRYTNYTRFHRDVRDGGFDLAIENTWDEFEKFCEYISGRDDVFYGTNKDVLLAD